MNILDFKKSHHTNQKITMVTCYDYWSAQIIASSNIDCILVGDSLAMVMHGYTNTINATIEMMCLHTKAVARGAKNKFLISDLPFLSYRQDLATTTKIVTKLMQAGACAVKIENNIDQLDTIKHLVNSGVPVMAHLGLTPQFVHQLGGFKVQGKNKETAEHLLLAAKQLEQAGCFAIVLECIPSTLAKNITNNINIPTIGIGAGKFVDGQVLVLHDLLGLQKELQPKFLKKYLNGFELMQNALNTFDDEVKKNIYPDDEFSYE